MAASGAEDVELGVCLARLNVTMGDSRYREAVLQPSSSSLINVQCYFRDGEHRQTFHPFVPIHHLIPGDIPPASWYWHFQVPFTLTILIWMKY